MLILETDRLRLRWFHDTASDADFLRALLNDPGWLANIGERNVRTRRQARHWIATRHTAVYGRLGFGFWAIERKSDGALMGMCGLIKRDTLLEVDVGYALMPAFRGQGYARAYVDGRVNVPARSSILFCPSEDAEHAELSTPAR